jgi:hypothetical protein
MGMPRRSRRLARSSTHADHHDEAQNPDLSRDWSTKNRPDDVSDDQHLETEQYHPSEVRSQLPDRVGRMRGDLRHAESEGDETADDHDCAADALNDSYHLAGDNLVANPTTLAMAATADRAMELALLSDGLTTRVEWSLQEHVSRPQDPHDVASEAHVAGMMPPAGLLREQR